MSRCATPRSCSRAILTPSGCAPGRRRCSRSSLSRARSRSSTCSPPTHHPCQALADLLTLRETFGALEGLRLAYVGDGNNVARSLALLGSRAGRRGVVASPEGYELEPGTGATLVRDPAEAVRGAHAVYTDVWVSMGDEETAAARRARARRLPHRRRAARPRRVPDAIALHDLPAHAGEEITAEVLYGQRQRIWDQAENRRHAQKALLEWLLP